MGDSTATDLVNTIPGADLPVCMRSVGPNDVIGRACRLCGHTDYLHPGPYTNPSMNGCVVCRVINMVGQPREICAHVSKRKELCKRGWGHDGKHGYRIPEAQFGR